MKGRNLIVKAQIGICVASLLHLVMRGLHLHTRVMGFNVGHRRRGWDLVLVFAHYAGLLDCCQFFRNRLFNRLIRRLWFVFLDVNATSFDLCNSLILNEVRRNILLSERDESSASRRPRLSILQNDGMVHLSELHEMVLELLTRQFLV